MPGITDRSSRKEPILKLGPINHGTLYSKNIVQTRRFYEEVLGLDIIQTSPISLMVRKGTDHVYAVVELPVAPTGGMHRSNHNGFEVGSFEEVEAIYQKVLEIKDEWGIKKVNSPRTNHGDHSFFFMDMDENWWEVVSVRKGGYVADFKDEERDLTGHHEFDDWVELWEKEKKLMHVHSPDVRKEMHGRWGKK